MENLAGYFLEAGDAFAAMFYLKKAISISPNVIQYRVELALILRGIGDHCGFRNQITQCRERCANSAATVRRRQPKKVSTCGTYRVGSLATGRCDNSRFLWQG